jgi:hypothetical protein
MWMQMKMEIPDELAINCTNLGNTSDIFGKVLLTATKLSDPSIFKQKEKNVIPNWVVTADTRTIWGPEEGKQQIVSTSETS